MKKRKTKAGSRKSVRISSSTRKFGAIHISKKVDLVLKYLMTFLAASLICFLLQIVSADIFFVNLFSILSKIFFLLSIAFFMALLVFLVLKISKKR
jgi:hypothetical protein